MDMNVRNRCSFTGELALIEVGDVVVAGVEQVEPRERRGDAVREAKTDLGVHDLRRP